LLLELFCFYFFLPDVRIFIYKAGLPVGKYYICLEKMLQVCLSGFFKHSREKCESLLGIFLCFIFTFSMLQSIAHTDIDLMGSSPGYGISLVAETTSGCFITADTAVSYARADDGGMEGEKQELVPAEDVGEQIASVLLNEIEQGGVVDTTHQVCVICSLFFFFFSCELG